VTDIRNPSRRRRQSRLGRWAIGAATVACAAWLAIPAPAQPVTFRFTGRGDGHGVGMSQYGAQGLATHVAGETAAKIMAWYFRGTTITTLTSEPNIRVLLGSGQHQITISVQGPGTLTDGSTGTNHALLSGRAYLLRPSGPGVLVTDGPTTVLKATAGVSITPTGSSTAVVNGKPYRGTFAVTVSGTTLTDVNTLPTESYVRDVVAAEMPSSWSSVALQAQAIATRSYGLASRRPSAAFDVYPDTRSQSYGGINAESRSTDNAVAATTRQVVTVGGKTVQTFFFSSSGGRTESIQDVWGGTPQPYYVGVPDPYDQSPLDPWPNPPSYTGAQLGHDLGLGSTVTQFQITQRGTSPRVLMARITLAGGRVVTLSGNQIQSDLGLPSTWFSVNGPASPGAAAAPTSAQIAAYVVTHYRYPRWRHADAILTAAARRNPAGAAALLSRGAHTAPSRAILAGFVAARYAPRRRAAVLGRLARLGPSRQVRIMVRALLAHH
jgi:stage II sporulation protein D